MPYVSDTFCTRSGAGPLSRHATQAEGQLDAPITQMRAGHDAGLTSNIHHDGRPR